MSVRSRNRVLRAKIIHWNGGTRTFVLEILGVIFHLGDIGNCMDYSFGFIPHKLCIEFRALFSHKETGIRFFFRNAEGQFRPRISWNSEHIAARWGEYLGGDDGTPERSVYDGILGYHLYI